MQFEPLVLTAVRNNVFLQLRDDDLKCLTADQNSVARDTAFMAFHSVTMLVHLTKINLKGVSSVAGRRSAALCNPDINVFG